MTLVTVSDLFDIKYGVNLDLNKLAITPDGINFVSRTAQNNGVAAIVALVPNKIPNPSGSISVAGGGSVMESFLQPTPYYSGRDLYYLTARLDLSDEEKLYYCSCLRANKYRFNYGRQANRTLADLLMPSRADIPDWVYTTTISFSEDLRKPFAAKNTPKLNTSTWEWFRLEELFDIRKGKRLTKANMTPGDVPFIGSIDSNNGYREFVGQNPIHTGNTITVNYNGSVAEAFYQPEPFWASDDVNVLYPKFEMNQFIAHFILSLVKFEKYRFNFGRKWHLKRMNTSQIKLPISAKGKPDYKYMEQYIKSLPYTRWL